MEDTGEMDINAMGYDRMILRNDGVIKKSYRFLKFGRGSKTEGRWWRAGTAAKKSDPQKRQSADSRFLDIFDAANEAYFVFDISSGSLIDVNRTAVHLFGYSRAESFALGLETIYRDDLPDSRREWNRRIQAAVAGERQAFEWRYRKKDNEPLWCEVNIYRCRIDHRDRLLVVVRDIRKRKKAEESLREAESKFHSIMESIEEPAYICSQKLHIEYMNPAMIRSFGHGAIGRNCYEIIHGCDSQCPWCTFERALQGEHIQYELVSPKNNRSYQVSSLPVFHSDQSISQLTVLKDNTESRELTKKLQQSQKMEAIGILAGGIAHDFNNLLVPIIGYAELMREGLPMGSHMQAYLDEIMVAGGRAKKLVQQILTFSRHSEKELKPQNFQAIIKETLELARATFPSTIQIRKNLNNRSGLVMADSTQLHQIVMNMVTNAFHAMEENGGTLTVALDPVTVEGSGRASVQGLLPGPYACLTITDIGTGMDKNVIPKVFDPYFSTKDKGKGTGLGLSLVHGIVKDSGGIVQVDSEKGKGTRVTIYLPAIDRKTPSVRAGEEVHVQGGNEEILLVDDEETGGQT